MAAFEVNKEMLDQLEAMGFPLSRAMQALKNSGSNSLEAAIHWIIDHENDPDSDQTPGILREIPIESPVQSENREERWVKAQELRDRASKNREEEEKKLEKEREKERIRAGKELLQAKRVAEENERKRILALREAEKAEEKSAREKILQKLQADKEERRSKHGNTPKGSAAAEQTSATVVHGTQTPARLKSAAETEKMRACLISIKRNHRDDDAKVRRAFQTLVIYVGNAARNPDVAKYRRIRLGNPIFQDRVGSLKGGIEFLELCGFEKTEDGNLLYLPREKVDLEALNSAGTVLQSAVTNPFFGAFSKEDGSN